MKPVTPLGAYTTNVRRLGPKSSGAEHLCDKHTLGHSEQSSASGYLPTAAVGTALVTKAAHACQGYLSLSHNLYQITHLWLSFVLFLQIK